MTLIWTSLWRFGYVEQELTISFTCIKLKKIVWNEWIFFNTVFVCQQAANIVRALELFVKPDVLSGENAYMCAKWVTSVLSDANPFLFCTAESVGRSISITFIHVRDPLWVMYYDCIFVSRCKKKVPATKRFTVHRTSNVLTLSLKRFANFSGGKITKVNKTFSRSWLLFLFFFFLEFCVLYQSSHVSVLSFLFCFRMLVTQNSWTSAPICLRAQAILSCMASTPFWCTRATVVTLATTIAMSR